MRLIALLLVTAACGPAIASADPPPASASAAASGTAPAPATATVSATATATARKLHATPLGERAITGDVRGLAFQTVPELRVAVNVGGALQVLDSSLRPVQLPAHTWRPGDPLLVVGPDAFDAKGGARRDVPIPKSLTCQGRAFSADGSRMSVDCQDASGDEATHVFDVTTGAEIGVFAEFQTAAPVRSGTITQSGNFIFWASRATGAFEEIKSHVTGPVMSSHSVMSPDEHALFTTVDRNWYSSDTSPARMLDPKNGRELFTLPRDVETVVFSPSSRTFAAVHSSRWGDMEHAAPTSRTWITIHSLLEPAALVRLPSEDVALVAISPGDDRVAVYGGGTLRLYALGAD
ncbi:MAG TPA: hypothetical protein VLM85_31250 [Polyangiaceae bacterium]|nr:hypothetical protein [Polyangiaceae bacterium]